MTSPEKKSKEIKNIKGGARPGAGRKAGSPNKKTAELQAAVAQSGLTPLEYMLQVMRNDSNEPRERLNAAVSAAPYVHAKLSSIEMQVQGDEDNPIRTITRLEIVALK
jgi:hypothetical protein